MCINNTKIELGVWEFVLTFMGDKNFATLPFSQKKFETQKCNKNFFLSQESIAYI